MNRCPKCSGWMNGPRFHRTGWGGEVLVYRCDCGYSEQRPCEDSKELSDDADWYHMLTQRSL